jgi:chromosomal replication initiation ATPase DnaA
MNTVFCVSPCEIRVRHRNRKVAFARQVGMYLAHVACGLTLTEVGRVFGRHRATVAHACAVVEDRRDAPEFDRAIAVMEFALTANARRPAGRRGDAG